ncbi:MAG TPA: multiheme c-type cytochrome [Longimicrobiaceae bacterium]|nr:multiheme c-type cytochrome [Longimicrobiaceae bacterium]
MRTSSDAHPRVREWQSRQVALVAGLLLFESLSGLSIYLLPFSVTNQVQVLLHTAVGLAFLAPYLHYQIRHWRLYRATRMTHVKLTGYFSMVATTVALLSGLVLSYQAVFWTRISHVWDGVHVVATFGVVAAVLPHLLIVVVRNLRARHLEAIGPILTAQRRFGTRSAAVAGVAFVVLGAAVLAYRPVRLVDRLPSDYHYAYGGGAPFAPSLARTSSGGAIDPRALGGSQSCGTAGCHVEITKEWEVSAHRYAAKDPSFRAVQRVMGEQNGPETTRYCGGCHDPISLFAGAKDLSQDALTNPTGLDEGVSCIACHGIQETDIKGNAAYVIAQPKRYLFELDADSTFRPVRDFLIRAYPRQHVTSLEHRRFKSPEFCAACHKQFIDKEINNVGWVQLQNQYDNWRKSRWNHPGDPRKTVECRECHMPLESSDDPASGDELDYNRTADDGKHRSHRFLGGNQFIPVQLRLAGGAEQARLTEKWLRGEIRIPEIEEKWRPGPAVPIELSAPRTVAPGEPVHLGVMVLNNKPGHDFPTGPLDIIQSWLEVVVTDEGGRRVFTSGITDARHFIEPGAFIFKAEPVDRYGKLIDRHNLWEMVGVRYRRSLFPGFSDRAEFTFAAPARSSTLHVSVRLQYRKFNQFLLNELFGETEDVTAPITTLSSAEQGIRVAARGGRE